MVTSDLPNKSYFRKIEKQMLLEREKKTLQQRHYLISIKTQHIWLGMAACAFNPSTLETEAGGSL